MILQVGGGGSEDYFFSEYGISLWENDRVQEVYGGDSCPALSVFNASELYIYMWLKWLILCFLYFTIIKEN